MRQYKISPAIVAAMRRDVRAGALREVGVPLYLELPSTPGRAAGMTKQAAGAEYERVADDDVVPGIDGEDDDFI